MGISRKKAAPAATNNAPPAKAGWRTTWRALYQPTTLLLAMGAIVTGVLLPYVARYLPDLSQREEYLLDARQMEVTQPPHWVPRNFVEQIIHDSNLPEKLPLLDDTLVQEIAEAFQLNPWVEEVVSVRKSYPAKVVVQINYRRPVAMVEGRNGRLAIDRLGVLLPSSEFAIDEADTYPLLTGVASTPQGPVGTRWGDPVVEHGAVLAATLSPVWRKLGLVSIGCPETIVPRPQLNDNLFILMARGGTQIVWGHSPADDALGEPPTEHKVARLQDYVKRFGGFDQPHGPYKIDIRHRSDVSRTPLSAKHAPVDLIRM
jgi:hypothetical protein